MTEAFVEGRFQTADGPRIEFRDYAPLGSTGGLPVLCLHGLTRNVRDFEELAPQISVLGHRVIVASQRGRAGSDPDPVPERYNPAVYTGDMLALLDKLSIDKAIFVGTSMGGLMTMIAAATAPHRIAGAVLNDIGPEVDPVGLARIQGYVGVGTPASTWEEAAQRSRETQAIAFPKETGDAFWMRFARRTYREAGPGRIVPDYDPEIGRTVQPGSTALTNLWPIYEALRPIPALIVRGELSDILSSETVARMHAMKPDLASALVPDVGHAPFLTEPSAWDAVREFLVRVS